MTTKPDPAEANPWPGDRRMTQDETLEELSQANPDAILLDGLEDAIIGIGGRMNMETVAVYDIDKIIGLLMKQINSEDMTYEECEQHAVEYFEYNVLGLWAGDGTPILVRTIEK
jgi:hypothetical protein